MSRSMFKYMIT